MAKKEVKLSCRNVWKVYGNDPSSFFQNQNGIVSDPLKLSQDMHEKQHIVANANVSFDVHVGEIFVIMGLSGSGKSTLIRHVNRLIEPTSGELFVDGENVLTMSQGQLREFRRKSTSMVFQKFALLPHKTVSQNVAYGLTIQGVKEKLAKEQSHRWIDRVGLGGFEERYPAQLSGGMQQRVGLARALATDAPILLMDEAFSALDPLIRTDMQNILLELQKELHKTILFITHDLDEALRIGDNIAILRDGKIIQEGDPQDIIMNPADDYITDFIKDINRSRVVELRSIMDVKDKGSGKGLNQHMTVEEALPLLNTSKTKSFSVIDDNKKVLGSVKLDSAIKALSRSSDSETKERYK